MKIVCLLHSLLKKIQELMAAILPSRLCSLCWQIALAFASVNSEGLNWADAVEGRPHPLAPQGGGNVFHSGGRQFASKRDPGWQAYAAWINGGARLAGPKE
jgi:hypothetical protein